MEESKLKKYLEVTTNVAVLLVAVAVLSALAWGYFVHNQKPQFQSGFQRGQSFAQLPTVSYNSAPQTLLIAMSTTCHYCSESIPFYKQLAEAQQSSGNAIHIVAVFPNSENEVKQYIQQSQLNVDTVAETDFKALNVAGTPTLLLIDKDGKILDFWVGKLSKDNEQQVIKAINGSKT
ncbi:MAG TPA: thioredoxin-like domain-containing protein [Pyrinomonadaceae bacterium]|jgi:thioredoxin-related protein